MKIRCFGYGPFPQKKDNTAFVRAAFEQGATFSDTAGVYGPFANEEIVGEALAIIGNLRN